MTKHKTGHKNSERNLWKKGFQNTGTHASSSRESSKQENTVFILFPEGLELRNLPENPNYKGPLQVTHRESHSESCAATCPMLGPSILVSATRRISRVTVVPMRSDVVLRTVFSEKPKPFMKKKNVEHAWRKTEGKHKSQQLLHPVCSEHFGLNGEVSYKPRISKKEV